MLCSHGLPAVPAGIFLSCSPTDMKLAQDINNLLILEHLIASGNERHCWHHPHDERLCVKTTHNAVTARRQNELELSYQHWLTKKGIETLHLARIYGEVNTNHGKGILLEKIVWQRYGRPVSLSEAIRDGLVSRLARVRESGKRLSLSLSRHNRFIYFVGPDGVGKTTLIKQTRKALPRSRYFRFKNSYRRSPFYSLLWRTRRYYLRRKHGRRLVKNQVDASMARVLFWVSVNSLFWRNLVALVTGRTLLSDRSPADLALEGHRTDDLISLRDGAPLFAMPPGRAMIHLHAAPDVILARKQEMSESQIRSYQDALFEAYLQRPAPLYISVATDNPVAQCVATITAGLGVGTNALQ